MLIVDDHALVRHAFRRLLDDDPVITVVGEAGDGDVAVRLARRLKPRVVVMDGAMPGAGGLTTTRRILELRPDVGILMLSMLFGTFAEEQWKTLVLPTLKLSTQHGYKTVLAKHLLPYWRLRHGDRSARARIVPKCSQIAGWPQASQFGKS